MLIFRLCVLLGLLCSVPGLSAQPTEEINDNYAIESTIPSADPLTVELVAEHTTIQPGRSLWLAIKIDHDPTWHTYWKHAGETGMPLSIDWQLPYGLSFKELHWPYPSRLDQDGLIGYGFDGRTVLLAEVVASADLRPSAEPLTLSASLQWLACSEDQCLPGESPLTLQLPISSAKASANQEHTELFRNARRMVPIKTWQPQAQRHNGLIEVHFQNPSTAGVELVKGHFFPAQPNLIDEKIPAIVTKDASSAGKYTLVLKESAQGAKHLQGVLQLEAANGNSIALEIDLPIHGAAKAPIAMNDKVPAAAAVVPVQAPAAEIINEVPFEGGFFMALVLAFAGGFLLNLMPCVLPVISLKILSFVQLAGKDRFETFKHGAAFTMGIMLSFWLLAGAMLLMQSSGQLTGWGFQLQEPLFVAILAAVLFLFGLSMFGIFEMGTSLTSLAGNAQNKLRQNRNALLSSFGSGVLTTAVATPCTGPFLGSAIGFAATLPALQVLTIFTSLAVGMALPYILLAAFPSWLRFLPKPGPWMSTFKEIVGFLMVATVLWLIWVFGAQTSSMAVSVLLGGLFFVALAAWTYGRYCSPDQGKRSRLVGATCAIAFGLAAAFAITASTSPLYADDVSQSALIASDSDWEPFSDERVAELHAQGIPVFIDFTAKWCLICQTNHLVVTSDKVAAAFKERGVVKMKADWTRKDEAIGKALRRFGRNAVPLYVLYGANPDEQPQILPQVLTPELVLDALNKA